MTFTLDEIKKLRAGITPGEWWIELTGFGAYVVNPPVTAAGEDKPVGSVSKQEDAKFIAASPAIVDQLVEQVEGLMNDNMRLRFLCEEKDRDETERELVKIGRENERLKGELAAKEQSVIVNGSARDILRLDDENREFKFRAEKAEAELEAARNVGVHLVARDHGPCKEMLAESTLRAQAAEDLLLRHIKVTDPNWLSREEMERYQDQPEKVMEEEIEKRMAELKAIPEENKRMGCNHPGDICEA